MNINYGYAGALLAPRRAIQVSEQKIGARKPGTINKKPKFYGVYAS